jgi:hypothetical protein
MAERLGVAESKQPKLAAHGSQIQRLARRQGAFRRRPSTPSQLAEDAKSRSMKTSGSAGWRRRAVARRLVRVCSMTVSTV